MSGSILHGRLVLKNAQELLSARGLHAGGAVQKWIDSEALRLCQPRVPLDQGILSRGQSIGENGGGIVYSAPYARRCYYENASFTGAPMRGNYWFEKMKNEGGREEILRGAAAISGGRVG
ncbi:MAG: hypothetical protein RSC40_05815 [Clostridia bacterium]